MDENTIGRLQDLAGLLARGRVAVVGDLIADRYVFGRPLKLSREAPVVVLQYERETVVPGSAANTIHNLRALGAQVSAFGIVGADALGDRLVEILGTSGADVSGVARAPCETVEKTRILAGDVHTVKQQVIRIDRDSRFAPDAASDEALCAALATAGSRCDVLVVSDYGYRTVSDRVRDTVLSLRGSLEIVVDSHDRLAEFPGAWMATPNQGEAERASGRVFRTEDDALDAGAALRRTLAVDNLLVTRGNQGMILFSGDGSSTSIPIHGTEEITDVSGAGDTVVALLAAARSAGATALEAAQLATVAAGVVVMKRGTATCTLHELLRALTAAGGPGEGAAP